MNKVHLTDHRTSFCLFAYIWLMYAIVYMTKNCFSGAMASIVSEGIMTKSQTGFITAMFYLAYAPLQIVGGKLADRWRPDLLILIGLLGAAVSNLVIYFNQNYYVMLISWTLNACLQFALWPAVFKIVSSQLAHEHRVRGVFYISFASTFGLCFTFIVGAIVSKWQDNFLISAVMLFALALGFVFIYSRASRKMVPDEDIVITSSDGGGSENKALDTDSKNMFRKCGIYFFIVICVVRGIVDIGFKNVVPTLLMESYENITPSIGNLLNIIIIFSGFLGMFVAKRLYPSRITDVIKGTGLLFALMIPLTLFTMLIGKVHVVFIVISLSLIIALCSGAGLFAQYYSMKFSKYGKNGEVSGMINSGVSAGIVIQSYGTSLVADLWNWTAVLGILAALCIVSFIIVPVIYPRWKRFVREYHI